MITLPKLPYELDEFKPHFSTEAMEFHRNKHHQGYVDNLNKLIQGTKYGGMDFDQVYYESSLKQSKDESVIFDNAAQIWNHTFYFEGINPIGDEDIPVPKVVTEYFTKHFGSLTDFKAQFDNVALKFFGSGWMWLVDDEGEGKIKGAKNAGRRFDDWIEAPLLTWDCWEHNYYIDFRNDRKAALRAFWKVVNWNKVEERINNIKHDPDKYIGPNL